jgi:hypothetical protein
MFLTTCAGPWARRVRSDSPLESLQGALETVWASLGLSSWAASDDVVPVDPEAALVAALQVYGLRSRIGNELVDWCARHGRLLILGRLRRIAGEAGEGTEQEVRDLLSTVSRLVPRLKWPSHGVALDGVGTSGKTGALESMDASIRLRTRAAFGTSVRLELMYLLGSGRDDRGWTGAELVTETAFTRARVYEGLAQLQEAGVVAAQGGARGGRFALRSEDPLARIVASLAPRSAIAPWRRAVPVIASLIACRDALGHDSMRTLSDALEHLAAAREGMAAAGMAAANPAPVSAGNPAAVRADLRRGLQQIADELAYALVHGPALGVVNIEATGSRAVLAYYAGRSEPDGHADLEWELERDGSITTVRGRDAPAVSERVKDSLHVIARDVMDQAEAHGSTVRVARSVS